MPRPKKNWQIESAMGESCGIHPGKDLVNPGIDPQRGNSVRPFGEKIVVAHEHSDKKKGDVFLLSRTSRIEDEFNVNQQ